MNYKNWDNRKTNRGRPRGNSWNWRGRGYNRMSMSNPFLQNLSWANTSTNYSQFHLPHHDTSVNYYNSRYQKSSNATSIIPSVIVAKPTSPLPGSEEYTQNKIQQTSDLIKRQLNIDNETCSASELSFPPNLPFSECLNNNIESEQENNMEIGSSHRLAEHKRVIKQFTKHKSKSPELIDVQEIHDKIIKHISNLSYSKKMSLVNQSTLGYDIAIQEVQKQKRLELSRALRDISKRQSQSSDDGEVINAIIPDIGIKIEDLPNDIIAELSKSLNIHLEDHVNNLVDPEACFKQAEEILNVNFENEDRDLKVFEQDISMDDSMTNQLDEDNSILENISHKGMNYDLLNKSHSEYHLHNTAQNNRTDYEMYISAENNIDNLFFHRNNSHDDNDNDDNKRSDYSKDVEFNNFCFENLDVSKSYLTSFPSAVTHSQNFDPNSNTRDSFPKICVRKDILLDTNTNHNVNTESLKYLSPISTSNRIESQINNLHRDNDAYGSIIDDKKYSVRDIECNSNWKGNSIINKRDTKLIYSKELTSSNQTTNLLNSSEPKIDNLKKRHDVFSNILQNTENYIISRVEPQITDKLPSFSENCSQKRWKSPGEKKMMADIQPNSNISLTHRTLNNTILEQMEEFNKTMMAISPKPIDNLPQESRSSPNIELKISNKKETKSELRQEDILLSTSKSSINLNRNNETSNILQLNEKILKQSVCMEKTIRNHPSEQTDAINVVSTNNDDSNSSIDGSEKNNCILKLETSPRSKEKKVQDTDTEYEYNFSNEGEKWQFNLDQKQIPAELKYKSPKPKHNFTEKQQEIKYKKNKTLESKNSYKISNDKYLLKDSFQKKELVHKDTLVDENSSKSMSNDKTTKNKNDSNFEFCKNDKLKECRKVKTAAEKKETIPISKILKNVYTQTNVENNTKIESRKSQLKECKNVEVQVTDLVTHSCILTHNTSENHSEELKYGKYLSCLSKLKEIDTEIEKLMKIKKSIYEGMECEYNSLNSIQVLPVQQKVTPSRENTKIGRQNAVSTPTIIEEKSKEMPLKKKSSIAANRKHKKMDSDNELEEGVRQSKRKKRHRNIEKTVSLTSAQHNTLDKSSDSRLLSNESINRESVRKPLSIKISYKNITQYSPKRDPEEVVMKKEPDQTVLQKTDNKKHYIEEGHDSKNGSNIKHNSYSAVNEKQSKKRNSMEKKMGPTVNKKRDSIDEISTNNNLANNVELPHTTKKHLKTAKSKKLRNSNENTNLHIKLSQSDREKIFHKNCQVVVERLTMECLENLKKTLREVQPQSQECVTESILEANNTCNIAKSEDSVIKSCDLKTISNVDVHKNCETTDLEFKNFTGAVLVLKVIQDVLLAGTENGHLYFFNIATADIIGSLSISEKPLTSICVLFDQNNNIGVGCLKGNLSIVNFHNKQIIKIIQIEDGIQCLEKEWDYIFMGSHRGHIVRYNFKKEKIENTMKIYDNNILAIKATQEGARRVILIATRNSEITVRDALSYLLLRTMESAFHPTVYAILLENNLVYCGTSQHDILIYTFQDGQQMFKYEAANSKGVVCMKIVGNLFFAGCYNGNIYIYNLKSNKYIGQLIGPGGMLLSMDICGKKIIVGTKSNKLKSLTIPQVYFDQVAS